ncbi:MAG: hypothetical protein KDD53_02830 [Bdellovibrionales bacterium]|nr:hypothetical protein [Bdellovibrionales bacterium]
MSIIASPSLVSAASIKSPVNSGTPSGSASGSGIKFSDLFQEKGLSQDLSKVRQAIVDGKMLNSRDLLLYQIRASNFHLRVEMASKVAESFSATVRKLQQG